MDARVTILDRIRTASLATVRTLTVCAPTMVEAMVTKVPRERCDDRLDWWSRALLDDVGVVLDVRGRENLEPHEPMVVMSNHQSLYDIPVLFQTLPRSVRMVAKTELFRVPVWSHALRAAEFVEIDRKNHRRAVRSLAYARKLIQSGISVWIAPEGTRSQDGRLLPFKKGGFVVAQDVGVPILPVTVEGTRRILPARTSDIHLGARVRVTIHPRVETRDVSDRDALVKRVREAIASGLDT